MVSTGGVIKDAGNAMLNKTGGWRTFKPEIDMKRCIDCATCWVFCPDGCILRKCVSNRIEYVVELDYCKGCGICANECPTEAIKMALEEK